MNTLSLESKAQVAALLVDGCSIRAAERMTGIHRDTIMRLGLDAGDACANLHDALVRNVQPALVQADEMWTFVGKKAKRVRPGDRAEFGDQYVFLAMDAVTKLVISYRVGRRSAENTYAFIADLRSRVLGRPQISTDGWTPYPDAINEAFGRDVDHGVVEKQYAAPVAQEASRRYSPSRLVRVEKRAVLGMPDEREISTSYSERLNLSVRVSLKRFARLTLAHSKRLRNLETAVSLFVAFFNFCRVHETLRVTPAMAGGLTDHVWTMAELLSAAFGTPVPPPAPTPGQQTFPGMSGARAKGEKRGSGPSRWHRGLRVIKGGMA